jgi:type IV secretory pathway TrbF-like protein
MPKYLVEAISQHLMRYVIECKEAGHAADTVVCNEPEQEFSQMHLGEVITSVREISNDEYLKIFDEDNDYLKSWDDEKKFSLIHKVDYKEDWEFS